MDTKATLPAQSPSRRRLSGIIILLVTVVATALGGTVGKAIVASYFKPSSPSKSNWEPRQTTGQTQPEWAALQKYWPAQYEQIVDTAPHTIDPVAMHNAIEPVIAKIIADHQSEINDKNLEGSYSVFVSEAKSLSGKYSAACFSFVSGSPMPVDTNSILTPDVIQRDIQTTTADLIQIATRPAKPASSLPDDQFQKLVTDAFYALPAAEQTIAEPLIDKGKNPITTAEDQSICDFQISLFSIALSAPPGTLKSMLARTTNH